MNLESKIQEIKKSASNDIYYALIGYYKDQEKEINSNYNMGLITFKEFLNQGKVLQIHCLKVLESENIEDIAR